MTDDQIRAICINLLNRYRYNGGKELAGKEPTTYRATLNPQTGRVVIRDYIASQTIECRVKL